MKYIVFLILLLSPISVSGSDSYKNSRKALTQRHTSRNENQKKQREAVQARRNRILQNGNVNNFYPKSFKIDWFIVNNKAYMAIQWSRRND